MIIKITDGWGTNNESPIEKIREEAYREGFIAGKNYIKDNVKRTVSNDAIVVTYQALRQYRENLIKWLSLFLGQRGCYFRQTDTKQNIIRKIKIMTKVSKIQRGDTFGFYNFIKNYIKIKDGANERFFNDEELKQVEEIQQMMDKGYELKLVHLRKGSKIMWCKKNYR